MANLIKHFTIVNYNVSPYYDCRVVIYNRKIFIRLATGLVVEGGDL